MCRCLLSDLLQFWVWVGEKNKHELKRLHHVVRPYLLTSNLICQDSSKFSHWLQERKTAPSLSFRQPFHCYLEYLLTKWFLNSCCHIHKHLYSSISFLFGHFLFLAQTMIVYMKKTLSCQHFTTVTMLMRIQLEHRSNIVSQMSRQCGTMLTMLSQCCKHRDTFGTMQHPLQV